MNAASSTPGADKTERRGTRKVLVLATPYNRQFAERMIRHGVPLQDAIVFDGTHGGPLRPLYLALSVIKFHFLRCFSGRYDVYVPHPKHWIANYFFFRRRPFAST